jgi:hypothetical protein
MRVHMRPGRNLAIAVDTFSSSYSGAGIVDGCEAAAVTEKTAGAVDATYCVSSSDRATVVDAKCISILTCLSLDAQLGGKNSNLGAPAARAVQYRSHLPRKYPGPAARTASA